MTSHRSEGAERRDPVAAASMAAPCVESLAALVAVDPFTLPAAERVTLLADLERHSAWFEAVKAEVMVAVAGPGPDYDPGDDPVADAGGADAWHDLASADESVCAEVSVALRISSVTAQNRIAVARDLYFKLTHTRALLDQGICSYAQANAIARECQLLSIADSRLVESQALSRVATQNPGQTRRSVRRAIARICPPEPAAELEREFARREVSMYSDGGVMATITAVLPAPDAIAVWNALTGCANRDVHESDTRTRAHRRADALTAWAHRELASPDFPRMQGKKRLETQIVIGHDTLIGLNDEPGDIVGFGPIPAVLARRLASESQTWRRLVTDPVTGYLLDYGTTTYTPPALLREYVIARDRTCQFPGCSQAGWRCDLDHSVPFTAHDTGGPTSAANLVTLCRRHHQLKTHHRWRYRIVNTTQEVDQREPESMNSSTDPSSPASAHQLTNFSRVLTNFIEWTSPRGNTYQVELTRQLDPPPEASPVPQIADASPAGASPADTSPTGASPEGSSALEELIAALILAA